MAHLELASFKMATIFDMELNDVEIDNATIINANACTSNERQMIDYDEFDDDEPIVVDNEIEVILSWCVLT